VIEAAELTKRFGTHTAVDGVSLRVGCGEVVGFLGPNGAGKTTTLRVLAGVFPPTSGSARIDGHDLSAEPLAARRRLGYAPEHPALHLEMTVDGQLAFAAAMKDVPAPARGDTIAQAVARTGLDGARSTPIRALSKGFRQRVGIAMALVGDPPALLLDEPTSGLDPAQRAETRALIRDLGRRCAVFVSSHALDDVETMCDRVVILHRGRVLADEPPEALAARLRPPTRIEVEARAPAGELTRLLGTLPGVQSVAPLPSIAGVARCRVEAEPSHDVRAALATAVGGAGFDLLALRAVEASLEEAFLALVTPPDRPG
jgi:ABC-2 type transport system ATP-binding protein